MLCVCAVAWPLAGSRGWAAGVFCPAELSLTAADAPGCSGAATSAAAALESLLPVKCQAQITSRVVLENRQSVSFLCFTSSECVCARVSSTGAILFVLYTIVYTVYSLKGDGPSSIKFVLHNV